MYLQRLNHFRNIHTPDDGSGFEESTREKNSTRKHKIDMVTRKDQQKIY